MSAKEKNDFKNKLIIDLKSDSDFILTNKLLSSQIKKYNETNSLLNNGREKIQLMLKMNAVIKKHLELNQLDKATRKQIIKAASK